MNRKTGSLPVIGEVDVDGDEALRRWYRYLTSRLMLPCDVTGIEDFQWEEFFILGPGDNAEYKRLQQNQPSYRDVFELTCISLGSESRWCLVPDELKAHVRRKSDKKEFVLGLSELKPQAKVLRPIECSMTMPFGSSTTDRLAQWC
jgi:hypothetical protein